MVLMIYCLRGGVESLGRMAEIIFPIYFFFFFFFSLMLIWFLLLSVEPFDIKNLTPVFGNGVFFKVGGFIFGASIVISQLFKLKQTRSVTLALGLIITPLSLISSSSYVEHLEIGFKLYVPYVHTFLQIILPILLLGIALIRKKLRHGYQQN